MCVDHRSSGLQVCQSARFVAGRLADRKTGKPGTATSLANV